MFLWANTQNLALERTRQCFSTTGPVRIFGPDTADQFPDHGTADQEPHAPCYGCGYRGQRGGGERCDGGMSQRWRLAATGCGGQACPSKNGPPTSYPDAQRAAVRQDSRRDDLKTASRAAALAQRRVLGHGRRRRSTNLRCLPNACSLVSVPLLPARVRHVRTLYRVRMVLPLQDLLRQYGVRPPEASSGRCPRGPSVGAAGAASAVGNEADRLLGPPGSRVLIDSRSPRPSAVHPSRSGPVLGERVGRDERFQGKQGGAGGHGVATEAGFK